MTLLEKASYISDVQIVQTDIDEQSKTTFDITEEDYTVLPPEREALLHLSDWDEESLQKIEQARSSFNQLTYF